MNRPKPETGRVIVSDVEAYIKDLSARVSAEKKATKAGQWYEDITKTVSQDDGSIVIYRSIRRVVLDDAGNIVRTKSGAPKRETMPESSYSEIVQLLPLQRSERETA